MVINLGIGVIGEYCLWCVWIGLWWWLGFVWKFIWIMNFWKIYGIIEGIVIWIGWIGVVFWIVFVWVVLLFNIEEFLEVVIFKDWV